MSACEECEEYSRADPSDLFIYFCIAAAGKVHIDIRTGHAGIKSTLNSSFLARNALRDWTKKIRDLSNIKI